MRIVIAPQEYKGTLTAEEAAAAIAEGVRRAIPDATIDIVPMADGGPGTVRAILAGRGGEKRHSVVTGPLRELVEAEWGMLLDGTAVIEMAAAAGLVMVPETQRDPRVATTYGVGELVRAALNNGAQRIIIGLGGSATNDGGAGMAQALGARLLDANGDEIARGGAALRELGGIDVTGLVAAPPVIGATDVRNPLTGSDGASLVYGPQKGATSEVARELDDALSHYAAIIERDLGVSVSDVPGAGSAGGLGAGLIAFLAAEIRPGIEIVAEVVGLADRVRAADLVITGEGRLDGQTRWGKTVAGVAQVAAAAGVPVIAVPGSLGDGWETLGESLEDIEATVHGGEPAMALTEATTRVLGRWLKR